MSPDGTLRAVHVWKRFRADRRARRIKHAVAAAVARDSRARDWAWVLRDIDFELRPGDSLGIVGSNGSGKSTLLKILTRVMYPYAGSVSVFGRVGALIEVAGGLHPELTGRENAFLQGSLLGMPRKEVARRFDEIVAFAELEGAIDRQVKHYSSGMRMRLGFSAAVFLDPAILLVDEVLAVGDAAFQQRSLERMRDALHQGTTLVLVSHDLPSVEATCKRSIWLRDGEIETDGDTPTTLARYMQSVEAQAEVVKQPRGPVRVVSVETYAARGSARSHEPLRVSVRLRSERKGVCDLYLGISDGPAAPIISFKEEFALEAETVTISCLVDDLPLPGGRYFVWTSIVARGGEVLSSWHPYASFHVEGPLPHVLPVAVARRAPIHVEATWEIGATKPVDAGA